MKKALMTMLVLAIAGFAQMALAQDSSVPEITLRTKTGLIVSNTHWVLDTSQSWGLGEADVQASERSLRAKAAAQNQPLLDHSVRIDGRHYKRGSLAGRNAEGEAFNVDRLTVIGMEFDQSGDLGAGYVAKNERLIGKRVGQHVWLMLQPDGTRVQTRVDRVFQVTNCYYCNNRCVGLASSSEMDIPTPVVVEVAPGRLKVLHDIQFVKVASSPTQIIQQSAAPSVVYNYSYSLLSGGYTGLSVNGPTSYINSTSNLLYLALGFSFNSARSTSSSTPTPIFCPPIAGITPPPSLPGPKPGPVTTPPNPFEGPGSNISTPPLPPGTGQRNANG